MDKQCLISLEGISLSFRERAVLNDVTLQVNEHDFMAITGPNGGGKTTLLRTILGLIKPQKGCVRLFQQGSPVAHLKFGYLPQKNLIDSEFPITVKEVIASGMKRKWLQPFTHNDAQRLADTIALMQLSDVQNRPIGYLSGGQLQRALLGRAIISNPEVLVLDEPLSYIDKHFEQHLYAIMQSLAQKATIILVSHEMSVISGMANRHIIVADGSVHECEAHHHFCQSECK